MSRLVNFYLGEATDPEGRTIEEIWNWDDESLEAVHDYVQWLFPLPEPSRFNAEAPLLTGEDVARFRGEARLGQRLQRSFERFLRFLGLRLEGDRVIDGANLPARCEEVWTHPNHNWLRISRVLRSLSLLGLGSEARALHDWLSEARERNLIGPARPWVVADTFRYWDQAIRL